MKRHLVAALGAALTLTALTACGSAPSTAPAPQERAGLSTVASVVQVGGRPELGLHTASGDITFWGGVNLGPTVPGHSPGELAIPAAQYRAWFPQMASMGVRFLRIYTVMPPSFYDELAAFDRGHHDAPLYLIQGVYLPDESYINGGTLTAPAADAAFSAEIRDASMAVHGRLQRAPRPGRAAGTWSTDVSQWVAAWIIGAELDPHGVQRTDASNAPHTFTGRYFRTTPTSTPVTVTEAWLARHMDELAGSEAGFGTSAPIAFVNWPTDDPLRHPQEPNPNEDLVSIDANHVAATAAWPGGTFASYHAYPYYPDFLRFQPDLQTPDASGHRDAYLAYLRLLRQHHAAAGIPTLISEFGVPSSIGAAHYGTSGRTQGNLSERAAMAMDAAMLRGLAATHLAGGILFEWDDEWFKATWNTQPRQAVVNGERRALWHDPLTNEQWFGVIASDPARTGWRTPYESAGEPLRSFGISYDASFVYLELRFGTPPARPVVLGFDVVPGGAPIPGFGAAGASATSDVSVTLDPARRVAQMHVRAAVDPVLLDGLVPSDIPAATSGWRLERLTADRSVPATGGLAARPAEFFTVGDLRWGSWDPTASGYDSLSTWWSDGPLIELRIPWSMLLLGDPSSRVAVVPSAGAPIAVPVAGIGVTLFSSGSAPLRLPSITWDPWNQAKATFRVKAGASAMADAWHTVNRN